MTKRYVYLNIGKLCSQSKKIRLKSPMISVYSCIFLLQPLLTPSSPWNHSTSPSPSSPVWIALQLIIFHISPPPAAHTDLPVKLSCVIWSCHSCSWLSRVVGPVACLLWCDWRCQCQIRPPHPLLTPFSPLLSTWKPCLLLPTRPRWC